MNSDRCECGWKIAGGEQTCRDRFEELIARDYSDPLFFRSHRLFVDAYALQHPQRHCVSAKSLAAHLISICAILERNADPSNGFEPLQEWLDRTTDLEKPHLSFQSCRYTLEYLIDLDDPGVWSHAVHDWAKSVWNLYEPKLQSWARYHLDRIA